MTEAEGAPLESDPDSEGRSQGATAHSLAPPLLAKSLQHVLSAPWRSLASYYAGELLSRRDVLDEDVLSLETCLAALEAALPASAATLIPSSSSDLTPTRTDAKALATLLGSLCSALSTTPKSSASGSVSSSSVHAMQRSVLRRSRSLLSASVSAQTSLREALKHVDTARGALDALTQHARKALGEPATTTTMTTNTTTAAQGHGSNNNNNNNNSNGAAAAEIARLQSDLAKERALAQRVQDERSAEGLRLSARDKEAQELKTRVQNLERQAEHLRTQLEAAKEEADRARRLQLGQQEQQRHQEEEAKAEAEAEAARLEGEAKARALTLAREQAQAQAQRDKDKMERELKEKKEREKEKDKERRDKEDKDKDKESLEAQAISSSRVSSTPISVPVPVPVAMSHSHSTLSDEENALSTSEGARELKRIERERLERMEREAAQDRPSASVDDWLKDASSRQQAGALEDEGTALRSLESLAEANANSDINALALGTAPTDLFASLLQGDKSDKDSTAKPARRPLPSVSAAARPSSTSSSSSDALDVDGFFMGNGATKDDEARLQREKERQARDKEAELKRLEEQRVREEKELTRRREEQRRREAEEAAALQQRLDQEQRRLAEARAQWASAEDKAIKVAVKDAQPSAIFDQPKVLSEKPKARRKDEETLESIFGNNTNRSARLFDDDDDDGLSLGLAGAALSKAAPKRTGVGVSAFSSADDDDAFETLFGKKK